MTSHAQIIIDWKDILRNLGYRSRRSGNAGKIVLVIIRRFRRQPQQLKVYLNLPALPSFSGAHSSKRGIMRPPVAMAINSISTPPTHLTAGNSFLK